MISFRALGDERGQLIALEEEKSVPFKIRRVYYIYGTAEGVERGFHAHKELSQVAISLAGSCDMVLNDGDSETTVHLGSATEGVLIEPKVWHYMRNFSKDCLLLVLADDYYDESDYIRDYDGFIDYIKKG